MPASVPGSPPAPLMLLVDDHPSNLLLMRGVLESRGFRVQGVSSGPEALAWVAHTRPDAVLLDVQMPGMSGSEVLAQWRSSERTRDLPVVAVTAMAMSGDAERLLTLGFDAYIAKPFSVQGFLATLERLGLPSPLRNPLSSES